MTKTEQSPTTNEPKQNRGPIWAVAAVVAVLAVAGLYFAFGREPDAVVEATPTTVAAEPTATTASEPTATTAAPDLAAADLETIEAGVAAFYSGDADRAAELFELSDRTDEQIREESAYQAAISGRLDLTCTESTPGSFICFTPYHNAMTDAIGQGGGHDTWPVVVEDGVITQFGFTEHSGMLIEMGTFLASEGRFEGYEDCVFGPFPESCATIQMENLDAWAAWHQTLEPADRVEIVVESWYRGDCEAAVLLAWGDTDCSASSLPAQTIGYESILGSEVSVENCESTSGGEHPGFSCEVHYSNAMNDAVGEPPSVTTREFVLMYGVMTAGPGEEAWYTENYPEDTELRESFQRFAESGDLKDEYTESGCATDRTENCANLILDNIDAWAAWYETNG